MSLAYPFTAWRKDWASSLRDALRDQQIGAYVVHETFRSNLLICSICREIRARPIHVAEISDPNWNVLFEAGLAFGFGKTVILAENANQDTKRARRIFPEFLRLRYRYTSDVVNGILAATSGDSLSIDRINAESNERTLRLSVGVKPPPPIRM